MIPCLNTLAVVVGLLLAYHVITKEPETLPGHSTVEEYNR